jgi:hypothetical protein
MVHSINILVVKSLRPVSDMIVDDLFENLVVKGFDLQKVFIVVVFGLTRLMKNE